MKRHPAKLIPILLAFLLPPAVSEGERLQAKLPGATPPLSLICGNADAVFVAGGENDLYKLEAGTLRLLDSTNLAKLRPTKKRAGWKWDLWAIAEQGDHLYLFDVRHHFLLRLAKESLSLEEAKQMKPLRVKDILVDTDSLYLVTSRAVIRLERGSLKKLAKHVAEFNDVVSGAVLGERGLYVAEVSPASRLLLLEKDGLEPVTETELPDISEKPARLAQDEKRVYVLDPEERLFLVEKGDLFTALVFDKFGAGPLDLDIYQGNIYILGQDIFDSGYPKTDKVFDALLGFGGWIRAYYPQPFHQVWKAGLLTAGRYPVRIKAAGDDLYFTSGKSVFLLRQ